MQTIVIDDPNHLVKGQPVPVGTELTVLDSTAAWMIEKGKAHLKTPEKSTKAPVGAAAEGK
jgi:hypothetical protein